MAEQDRGPQCIVGNGACPPECPLNEHSTGITEVLGDKIDPFHLRLSAVFGDTSNHDINVTNISRVMGSCINDDKASHQA